MKIFKLIPSVSPSEKEYISSISEEQWTQIKNDVYSKNNSCFGCGYTPNNKYLLQIHLHGTFESPEFILLCEGCHSIRHFDKAIELGWVVLVNSVYSQEELMKKNRSSGTILNDINNNKIVLLKKKPQEYLNEILESELNANPKTKVLFGNKFTWKK